MRIFLDVYQVDVAAPAGLFAQIVADDRSLALQYGASVLGWCKAVAWPIRLHPLTTNHTIPFVAMAIAHLLETLWTVTLGLLVRFSS